MSKVNGLRLLGVGNNAKTSKGDGSEYLTAILYLAPYTQVYGVNVCPLARLAGCHDACLYTAGRGRFSSVQAARIRKTQLWRDNRAEFLAILGKDIERFRAYCQRKGVKPCVRLNGTSDIAWERYGVPQAFPDTQFYDYTKTYRRVLGELPPNYHLTLSYSEASEQYTGALWGAAQLSGANVAVVFRDKRDIPRSFRGRAVVNGDRDDLRFLDPPGTVVALYAKGAAKQDYTGFVID